MSNKTPIIFLIILLSVIIFGLVMFLVTYLCGGEIGMMNFGSGNNRVIFDKTFEGNDIKNIDIKQDAGNVIFKESSDGMIRVVAYGKNENDIMVDVNDDKLEVDDARRNKFVFFNFGSIKNDIIVYVPSTYSHEIKVQNDLGDCEILNLENATIDIDCDAGNVAVGKVKNATIKCDLGKVEIEEVSNKCNVDVDSGSVKMKKISIQEDSKIKVDLGNIDIEEINDIYVEANVDLGKTNVNGSNRNANVTLKIECDCGNINVGK